MVDRFTSLVLAAEAPESNGVRAECSKKTKISNVQVMKTRTVEVRCIRCERSDPDRSRLVADAAKAEEAVLVEGVGWRKEERSLTPSTDHSTRPTTRGTERPPTPHSGRREDARRVSEFVWMCKGRECER